MSLSNLFTVADLVNVLDGSGCRVVVSSVADYPTESLDPTQCPGSPSRGASPLVHRIEVRISYTGGGVRSEEFSKWYYRSSYTLDNLRLDAYASERVRDYLAANPVPMPTLVYAVPSLSPACSEDIGSWLEGLREAVGPSGVSDF